jgi:hypothetical protein
MDNFNLPKADKSKSRKRSAARVWNILTILMLVTIYALSQFSIIFTNPNSFINLFLHQPAAHRMLPTSTVTPRMTMVPTWTPTLSVVQATVTSTITSSPSPIPNTATPEITATPSGYTFEVQEGSPSAVAWTSFHPEADCNWSGVAGQVTSLNDEAVPGLLVQLGGSMPGMDTLDMYSITGYATQYGEGGYEITLANSLVATTGTIWIQLMDQQKLPLSDKVYFDTYDDCEMNLIMISFDQVR